jgi:phage tail protein X
MRKYTTVQGDTWDYIAYKAYGEQSGTEFYMNTLLDANPAYMHYVIFPADIALNIPDIEVELPKTLPPWKRGA